MTTFPAGVFSDLTALVRLHLDDNLLPALPTGAFSGVAASLNRLLLEWNEMPKVALPLVLERVDDGSTAGEATVAVGVAAAAPFAITIPLAVSGGTLGATSATIAKGETLSGEVTVTQTATTAPATVGLGAPPGVPNGFTGLTIEAGPPLVLFEQVKLILTPESVPEERGVSRVTATVSPPAAAGFTVNVTAAPVAPAVAADFMLSTDKTLTFAAGATRSTGAVTITAVDNADAFPPAAAQNPPDDKTVTVSGTVTGASVAAPVDRTLEIADDEAPVVTARFERTSYAVRESEVGGEQASVKIRLSGDPKRQVVIPLLFDARHGVDNPTDYLLDNMSFAQFSKSVTFESGQTEAEFMIRGVADGLDEGVETFRIYLSDNLPTKVRGSGFATVLILRFRRLVQRRFRWRRPWWRWRWWRWRRRRRRRAADRRRRR